MPDIEWIVLYMALGAITGFMAGLLGLGGGGMLVPLLTSIFTMQGMSADTAVHLALLIRPLNSFKRHILHMDLGSKKQHALDCSPASSCDRWQRYAIFPWYASAL